MEGKENNIDIIDQQIEKLDKDFDNLPIGEKMTLKFSMLHPIDGDDFKKAQSQGPLEVARNKENKKIMIDDGNHRYHEMKRDILMKNDYKEPDWREVEVDVIKVYPTNTWIIKQ